MHCNLRQPDTVELRHYQTLYEIWAKLSNSRRSYCSLNIWPYYLEHVWRVALWSGIVCTKFKLSQDIRSWNVTIFDANTWWHAVTLTFNPLTLKVCDSSGVTWSQSVVNLIEIEHSPADFFVICQIFASVTSRCDLVLWPVDLELVWYFGRNVPTPFVKKTQECVDRISTKFETTQGDHRTYKFV